MKIFLGYAKERETTAWKVYYRLTALGHTVWLDKVSLTGADDWDAERERGQRAADFVIHLLSIEFLTRPGVMNREVNLTLKLIDDQPVGSNYVLGIRLEEFRVPAPLLRFQYIDYWDADFDAKLEAALAKREAQLGGHPYSPSATNPTTVVSAVNSESAAKLTSVKFEFTDPLFSLEGNYLVYPGVGLYWEYVNARLKSAALEGYVSNRALIKELAEEGRERILEYDHPYGWLFNMSEFFRKGDVVSVRCYTNIDFGGAHPNHYITTYNFLGERSGSPTMQELLGYEKAYAKKIIEYCQMVLQATYPEEMGGDSLKASLDDVEQVWELIGQYGVDSKGVTINLSPYQVLPYVFGVHEILVPWDVIDNYLGSDYKELRELFW